MFVAAFNLWAAIKAAEHQRRYEEAVMRHNEEMAYRAAEGHRWQERTIEVEFRRLS